MTDQFLFGAQGKAWLDELEKAAPTNKSTQDAIQGLRKALESNNAADGFIGVNWAGIGGRWYDLRNLTKRDAKKIERALRTE